MGCGGSTSSRGEDLSPPPPGTKPDGYWCPQPHLDPLARVILMGVYDDENVWSKLRGMKYIVKQIWELVVQFNQQFVQGPQRSTDVTDQVWFHFKRLEPKYLHSCRHWTARSADTGTDLININMMPFIMDCDFRKTKLPDYLHRYRGWIGQVALLDREEVGRICYLTVHESFVKKGKAQRRPGLHVESPGTITVCREDVSDVDPEKPFIFSLDRTFFNDGCAGWGALDQWDRGGIYMASNVSNSCVLWDCKVEEEGIGRMGNVEHLRANIQKCPKYELDANTMYWITDRTPHEVLPMKEDGYRVFLRIVTHRLSFWYEQHCTPNPNGVVPDPAITRIIQTNKFNQD